MELAIVVLVGVFSGTMAGLLGVGGGIIVVPSLVALGLAPINATATSTVVMVFSSLSGTFKNWRDGHVNFKRVLALAVPSMITAQLGVFIAHRLASHVLLVCFGIFLLINIYLFYLRKSLRSSGQPKTDGSPDNFLYYILAGVLSGFLAGLFGIGGGVILVPLLVILFKDSLKDAARLSLAVIILTALSAFIGYALKDKVLYTEGICLGIGGLIGAQIGTRLLGKVSEKTVSVIFQSLMICLATYTFWSAFLLKK